MSGTLFSTSPRRDSLRPPRVATSNESQGDRSAPPPPSERGWLCDEPYKYPIRSSKNALEMCNEIVEKHDEHTYRQLKEEINFLMVVAGLFLAIVAAFTVESYKSLREDKQDTMSDLLVEVVRLLNDTSAQGKARLPKLFTPNHHAIVVNSLWFFSMILDLIAVAMGTFCLQWISAFSRGSDLTAKSIPSHQSLALRQLRHDGLVGWGILYAPEALLFIVQLSIGLFICGLLYFLWDVNKSVAIPVLAATGIAAASLCLISLLPFLQFLVGVFLPATLNASQCPYKSPTSWFIHNAGNVLLYILKMFLNRLPQDWVRIHVGFDRWWGNWPLHVTGFNWKTYDSACQRLRAGVRSPLSYFESGLVSALDHIPYEGEAKDIISSYLENLVPVFKRAQDWEVFSQQKLSNDEKSLLNRKYELPSQRLPRSLNTVGLQLEHAGRIKADFLSALILQHLTGRHNRLARLLLHRRVELYIRVKNSTDFILSPDGSHLDFGRSLDCPCQNDYDVAELDLELKFQFLRCIRHLINIRRFNDLDIMSAAAIIRSESVLNMIISTHHQSLSVSPLMNPPAGGGHIGLLPNQSSPTNIQIGNLSNHGDPGTTSSPPNDLETGGPEPATHNTSAEDHQFRTSFESLCHDVWRLLLQLSPLDFESIDYYQEFRKALRLPVEPGPESVHTGGGVVWFH